MAVDDLGVYKHRRRLSRWNVGQYNYEEGNTLAQLLHQDDSRTHTHHIKSYHRRDQAGRLKVIQS